VEVYQTGVEYRTRFNDRYEIEWIIDDDHLYIAMLASDPSLKTYFGWSIDASLTSEMLLRDNRLISHADQMSDELDTLINQLHQLSAVVMTAKEIGARHVSLEIDGFRFDDYFQVGISIIYS
jgi:hypothetical protein